MLELHVKTDDAPRFQLGSPRSATLKRTTWLGGHVGPAVQDLGPARGQGPAPQPGDDDPDEDRGEPPPDPRDG